MNVFGYMQKLGKAIMLPIATLPIAAILLRIGQPDLLNIPFIAQAGEAIFSHLPLLFALGIAIGISVDGAGAAALAGGVGYFVLTAAAKTIDETIDMSFFGGIIAGIAAGHVYNRFHNQRLPDYLAFFAGSRLVPILTGLLMLALAYVLGYVWPVIQNGIDTFSHFIIESGNVGKFIYATLNRALIPVGLHHVMNSVFFFGVGEFTNAAGEVVRGDIARFFAGDPTAGTFLVGFYPIMMFGLPAAALAMYMAAPKKNRAAVGGMLLSLALTAALTGVTEPIEFMFMFLAPALYGVHAVLTGLSAVVTNMLGITHGFGFSAGLFDFVLNWGLATKPALLIPVGLSFGAVYFVVFYFSIRAFNLKTPGRDENESEVDQNPVEVRLTKVLGGPSNIVELRSCITRVRAIVEDPQLIDDDIAKSAGVKGVIRTADRKEVQLVIGKVAPEVVLAMQEIDHEIDWDSVDVSVPDEPDKVPTSQTTKSVKPQAGDKAAQYLVALGGHDNLTEIGACITRLRVSVKDSSIVKDADLKGLGAQGVVRVGDNNIQVILGPLAEVIASEMKSLK